MYEFKERENQTGIPDRMKSQFEEGSGFLLDNVRVHYNSMLPQRAGAYAYTQGNQVYLGPGQEKHLGHELGHVIQQKQGMVKPTSMINGMPLNDDADLEREADQMAALWGNAAIQTKSRQKEVPLGEKHSGTIKIVQRKVGLEFQVMGNSQKILGWGGEDCGHGIVLKDKEEKGYKITADMGDYEYVTYPVDERNDDGITKLEDACSNMAVIHRALKGELEEAEASVVEKKINDSHTNALAREAERQRIKKLYDNGYWPYAVGQKIFWLPQPEVDTAHPQATVGIRIDKLGVFIKRYIEEAKKAPRVLENPAGELPKPMSYLSNGGSKKKLKEQQDTLLISTLARQRLYEKEANVTDAESGFLSLLAMMIQGIYGYFAKLKKSPWNAKSVMPLMPRTSLNDAFLKLPEEARRRIKGIRQNIKARESTPILRIINGIPSARKIGGKIETEDSSYANVLKIIIAAQRTDERGRNSQVVTLGQWLRGLGDSPITSSDILAQNFCSVSELYGEASGSHNLYDEMSRSTDIGYDVPNESGPPEIVEGMLIEIRNMQRQVPIDEWKDVAKEVAILTRLVNKSELPQSRLPPITKKVSTGQKLNTVNRAPAQQLSRGYGTLAGGHAGHQVSAAPVRVSQVPVVPVRAPQVSAVPARAPQVPVVPARAPQVSAVPVRAPQVPGRTRGTPGGLTGNRSLANRVPANQVVVHSIILGQDPINQSSGQSMDLPPL